MPNLVSPRLGFSRDGRTLVELEPDALLIVDPDAGLTARIAFAHVRAAVAFADQIWVAHGRAPQLTRITRDGRSIGASVALAESDVATLLAAPVGPAAAVWTARPRQIWIEEGGALTEHAGPTAEIAIPLTGRRWVTATGARVVAPSGLACELAGARVLGGAVVHDGTEAAMVVARPSGRELVVVGLANGRPKSRQAIATAPARVAVRRGLLGIQVEARRVALLDLRSGRVLGEIASPEDITDFALDPDGQRIALRGSILEVLRVGDAIGRRVGAQVVDNPEAPEAPIPVVVPAPLEAVTDAIPTMPIVRPIDVRALAPVRHVDAMPRAQALDELDREIRNIALRTLRAIARAWDTRRLGYGNEGRHPYEHEVAALLGMNHGFATEHLAAAEDHLAAHDRELDALADRRGPSSPLGALAAELGLSSLAVDLLLAVAAPALWSEAARLYGVLANDPHRAIVDEALLDQIFAGRALRHDLAAELDARAPLIQLGVITVAAGPRPFAGLEVDPVVLARIRQTPPDLGGIVVRSSDRALEELALAPNLVTEVLAMIARASEPGRIVVRGRAGSGRRTLVAALADEAGRALGVIDAATLPRAQRGAALQAALRRAHLAGLLPFVVGLEDVALSEREDRDVLVEVLRAHPGPLAVRLPPVATAPLDPGHVAIELPVLEEGQRIAVWRRALADAGLTVADPSGLAARYRSGPGSIYRAIATVVDQGDGAGDATHALETYIRQTRDRRLGEYARRVERLARWESLVLPGDILDSLHELVARVRHRRTVFETWGMDEAMATARGLTALFSGPPGTGKTLVAGAIARALGLDLYQVDLSKVMSKWIGETERHLGAIFDSAEDGQVVLLFDEADSLFAKRTEVRSSNDRYANLEVNYLLQRLDSFEGIAILTTNAVRSIDPALKRRLSFQLSFPFPDEETREQLWRAHLPARLPIRGELALDRLAHKYQLSGGYIRNACLRAAFLAARDGAALTQHHLERAVALEFAELGKLSSGGAID